MVRKPGDHPGGAAVAKKTADALKSAPFHRMIGANESPRISVGRSKGKKGSVDRIVHNGNNSKAVTNALRWFRIPIIEEINTLISPVGSMYVEPEYRLNISASQLTFMLYTASAYYMLGGIVFHAREYGGSVLTDSEVAHSNGMTLNELLEGWFPVDSKEHDFEFLTAPAVPYLDEVNGYRLRITINIKDIMEKVNSRFFQAPVGTIAQLYDIYAVVFGYTASTTYYYYSTTFIEGRMAYSQSKLL